MTYCFENVLFFFFKFYIVQKRSSERSFSSPKTRLSVDNLLNMLLIWYNEGLKIILVAFSNSCVYYNNIRIVIKQFLKIIFSLNLIVAVNINKLKYDES